MNNYASLWYYVLRGFLYKFKFPIGISIDVTNKCNLRCKHCYFFQQDYKQELKDEELLSKIKEIKEKYPSIIHASWVGGEPLLRKDLVERGMKLFPWNMIITNGTLELPPWKNCVFNISVDGTKKYYEKIRGVGNYEKIKEHANRDDIKVNIVCVLNRQNRDCVEDLLAEWKMTKVGGINFDFYTPIEGIQDDLWLDWEERDNLIFNLLELKNKYGSFLLNPEPVLKLMISKNAKKVTHDCLLKESVISLDPMGDIKKPCILGSKADCSKCGCAIPFFQESVFIKKQIRSLPAVRKGFV